MNLIKASDLALPRISGTVSVNLEELDRLRAEHATAVKLAQELESKQALVKIVVGTMEWQSGNYVSTFDSKGKERRDWVDGSKQFVQQSVEYKNFDEFRETIRIEEYGKIEKKFRTLNDELDSKKRSLEESNKNLTKVKGDLSETKKTLTDALSDRLNFERSLSEKNHENEELSRKLKLVQERCDLLGKSFVELQNRKITLGYWLKTKLSDFRNLR